MQSLIDVYGPAGSSGLGSAVFTAPGVTSGTLEAEARQRYQTFVGEGWGARAAAWQGGFKELYRRAPGATDGIVAQLHAIKDPALRGVVTAMIDDMENPDAARAALAAAFDYSGVRDLRLYALGDGEQMTGVQVAALNNEGNAIFLTMVLD